MENLNADQQHQFKKLISLYKKLEDGTYNTYYEAKPDLWVFEGNRKKNGVYADEATIEAFEDYIR